MSRLAASIDAVRAELATADLADAGAVRALLTATHARRRLDLSDLSPAEQAHLAASRAVNVLPGERELAARITERAQQGRPFVAKFGIDPTGAEVHLGHAVPIIVLSRFQRMGHRIALIIGDFTASIGDPSGRSSERPPLTDDDIARNLATYQDQIAPFFDFERAGAHHNGDWLREVRLPALMGVLARIPVSQALQREDFRRRLDAGSGVAMSEFLYAVVMALDSVEVEADVELGGVDQLLNLQMGRTVMEVHGQDPQLVLTVPLIEGLDGSGAKMSKSAGNYVALTDAPGEVFGKIMSIPDRLVVPYLRAWTEWDDSEIALLEARVADRGVHPMDAKRLLAGEVVAALHGLEAAMAARADWDAQFSKRSLADVESLPSVADPGRTVVEALQDLGFVKSTSDARRLATQGGLKLVYGAVSVPLEAGDVYTAVREVARARRPAGADDTTEVFLRAGRRAARVTA